MAFLDSNGLLTLWAKLKNTFTRMSSLQISIAASDWSNKSCTKSVTGATASNHIHLAPATKADYKKCKEAAVWPTAQASGTVTFSCETTPTESITINIEILY